MKCYMISLVRLFVFVDVVFVMLKYVMYVSSRCLWLNWLLNGLNMSVLVISLVNFVLNIGVSCVGDKFYFVWMMGVMNLIDVVLNLLIVMIRKYRMMIVVWNGVMWCWLIYLLMLMDSVLVMMVFFLGRWCVLFVVEMCVVGIGLNGCVMWLFLGNFLYVSCVVSWVCCRIVCWCVWFIVCCVFVVWCFLCGRFVLFCVLNIVCVWCVEFVCVCIVWMWFWNCCWFV